MMLSDLARLTVCGVLGVGISSGCSCSSAQTAQPRHITVTSAASTKTSAAAPVASALGTDRAYVKTFSVASNRLESLDECIDFTIRIEPRSKGTFDWDSKDPPELRVRLARLGTELSKPCAEQFADRVVLATCVAITKREGQELQLVERYYNPATVGMDDIYMQECLRVGGTWQAVAVDSPEFRKAQGEATLRGLAALAAGSG